MLIEKTRTEQGIREQVQAIVSASVMSNVPDPKALLRRITCDIASEADFKRLELVERSGWHGSSSIRIYDKEGANVLIKDCGPNKTNKYGDNLALYQGAALDLYDKFFEFHTKLLSSGAIKAKSYALVAIAHYGTFTTVQDGSERVYVVMDRLRAKRNGNFDLWCFATCEMTQNSREILSEMSKFKSDIPSLSNGIDLIAPQVDIDSFELDTIHFNDQSVIVAAAPIDFA